MINANHDWETYSSEERSDCHLEKKKKEKKKVWVESSEFVEKFAKSCWTCLESYLFINDY